MIGKIYKIFKRHNLKMPNKRNLSDRINKDEFIKYLEKHPTIESVESKFKICRCSVYNLIKKYHIEYNFSKSVQILTDKAED